MRYTGGRIQPRVEALWSQMHPTHKNSNLFLPTCVQNFITFLHASEALARNITEGVPCLQAMQLVPVF